MDALTNFIGTPKSIFAAIIAVLVVVGAVVIFVESVCWIVDFFRRKYLERCLRRQRNICRHPPEGRFYVRQLNGAVAIVTDVGPECAIEHCDLDDLDFSGRILGTFIFRHCVISNTIFNGTDLDGCRFENCQFVDCQFFGTKLKGAQLWESQFSECSFSDANLTGAHVDSCVFERCTFKEATLKKVIFLKGAFSRCSFVGAVFEDTEFHVVTTSRCTFTFGDGLIGIIPDDAMTRRILSIVLKMIARTDKNSIYPVLLEDGSYEKLLSYTKPDSKLLPVAPKEE